jgi:hypothetical protein
VLIIVCKYINHSIQFNSTFSRFYLGLAFAVLYSTHPISSIQCFLFSPSFLSGPLPLNLSISFSAYPLFFYPLYLNYLLSFLHSPVSSRIFCPSSSTFTVLLIRSFLILSVFVTPHKVSTSVLKYSELLNVFLAGPLNALPPSRSVGYRNASGISC